MPFWVWTQHRTVGSDPVVPNEHSVWLPAGQHPFLTYLDVSLLSELSRRRQYMKS